MAEEAKQKLEENVVVEKVVVERVVVDKKKLDELLKKVSATLVNVTEVIQGNMKEASKDAKKTAFKAVLALGNTHVPELTNQVAESESKLFSLDIWRNYFFLFGKNTRDVRLHRAVASWWLATSIFARKFHLFWGYSIWTRHNFDQDWVFWVHADHECPVLSNFELLVGFSLNLIAEFELVFMTEPRDNRTSHVLWLFGNAQ